MSLLLARAGRNCGRITFYQSCGCLPAYLPKNQPQHSPPCITQALQGLQKKGLPAGEVAAQGNAIGKRHELVLHLLNLFNAGGSLVLPCCLVLNNKVRAGGKTAWRPAWQPAWRCDTVPVVHRSQPSCVGQGYRELSKESFELKHSSGSPL